MPNGEGTPDPRFETAEKLRAFLTGLLAGAIERSLLVGDQQIVETSFEQSYIILQLKDGNYRVKIDLSF